MVKILEKIVEEDPREGKFKQLLELARETTPGDYVVRKSAHYFSIDMRSRNLGIMVYADMNRLDVYDSDHFDAAYHLAELYEQKTREEFTVQKRYADSPVPTAPPRSFEQDLEDATQCKGIGQ